jgi:serine protease Do
MRSSSPRQWAVGVAAVPSLLLAWLALGSVGGLGEAAATLGTVAIASAADPISLQEVILRAKPATVLVIAEVSSEVTVNCGSGPRRVTPKPLRETGSGWFVDGKGWVVTSDHVVQAAHQTPPGVIDEQAQRGVVAACVRDELAAQGLAPGQRPDIEERLRRDAFARALSGAKVDLKPATFILLSNGARLPAQIVKYSSPVSTATGIGVTSGRDLALLRVDASMMPALQPSRAKVQIGDPIHILGFPGVMLTHELLNRQTKAEASVTNGTVSGFKEDVRNHPVIQTDALAAWGNSGGPVIDDRGQVVGVLTFVSASAGAEDSIVPGFNFVVPADAVRNFLAGTPVDLGEESPFNAKWFDGLHRYFRGDWRGAVSAMRAANRLQPEFPDVKRLLADAEEKVAHPPPRPFPWAMVTLAVLGLGAVMAMVMGARHLRANRHRVRPAEVAKLLEGVPPPVLLDTRSRPTYAASPFRLPGALHVPDEDLDAGPKALTVDPTRTVIAYCT